MALEIRSIPVLTGEDAERSRKYLKEHGGKGPFAK